MELLERLERLDPVKSAAIERLEHLKLLEPLELLYPMLKVTGYIRSVKQRENEDYLFTDRSGKRRLVHGERDAQLAGTVFSRKKPPVTEIVSTQQRFGRD